ncbi:MAG: glycosyltransferase family 2 protein, partial [Candidatus Hydrothermarchaeota archaeon]
MIVAALPAYNEEIAIGSVILRARKHADKVIVVDDGSEDNTAEIAELAGAIVFKHERNMGYGAAIRSCFRKARELNADILVTIDADGQHDPSEIPKLIEPIQKGEADVVIGSRFLSKQKYPIPLYRLLGMKVLDKTTNFFLD